MATSNLATQQGALNQQTSLEQTWADRPNVNTPWGSSSWNRDPAGGWTNNVALNPADQTLLDNRRAADLQRANATYRAGSNLSGYGSPMNFDGLPGLRNYDMSQLGNWGNVDFNQLKPLQDFSTMGGYQTGQASNPNSFRTVAPTGLFRSPDSYMNFREAPGQSNFQNVNPEGGFAGVNPHYRDGFTDVSHNYGGQRGLDGAIDSLPELKGMNLGSLNDLDPSFAAVEKVREAMMGRMAPDRAKLRDNEIQRLKNQGIPENSAAMQQALRRLDQGDTDAQQQALLGAMGASGDLFNRGLAENTQNINAQQLIAALSGQQRGQLFNERGAAANMHNQNMKDELGREMAVTGFNNQNRMNAFGQEVIGAEMNNQNRRDQFGQQVTSAGVNNQNAMNQFNQGMAGAQMGNQNEMARYGQSANTAGMFNQHFNDLFSQQLASAGQNNQNLRDIFGQSMGLADQNNQNVNSRFGQHMAATGASNNNQQMMFQALLDNAGFQNSTRNQQFGEQSAQNQLAALIRHQNIGERQTLRQNPLQEYLALSGNETPGMPQFPNFMRSTGYEGADLIGQSNADRASSDARRSGNLGLAAGLGAAAIKGGAFTGLGTSLASALTPLLGFF